MSDGGPVCHVFVVDDSRRFALHVWRALTGVVAWGIGERRIDDPGPGETSVDGAGGPGQPQGNREWIDSGGYLRSPDAAIQVWWLHADQHVEAELLEILGDTGCGQTTGTASSTDTATPLADPQTRVRVLLDVHGAEGYDVEEVLRSVDGRSDIEGVEVVSAYRHTKTVGETDDGEPREVWDKNTEFLERLRRLVRGETSPPTAATPQPRAFGSDARTDADVDIDAAFPEAQLHVLVTGAGFELADARGSFGFPPNSALLERTGRRMAAIDGRCTDITPAKGDGGFPIVEILDWGSARGRYAGRGRRQFERRRRALRSADDLDQWWNDLLRLESDLQDASGAGAVHALGVERQIRDAFRQTAVDHDWGRLKQADDAARLGFAAWLSTNYTRFADRSIDADTRGRQWRIVGTEGEAQQLMDELVHAPPLSPTAGAARALFKLHGDLAHLETMAIAGHDKEATSPLRVRVAALSRIYVAAEDYLRRRIEATNGGSLDLVWHIVGHGLRDRLLMTTLLRISSLVREPVGSTASRRGRVSFVLVNPTKGNKVRELYRTGLVDVASEYGWTEEQLARSTLWSCNSATVYLSRLRRALGEGRHRGVDRTDGPFPDWLWWAAQRWPVAEPTDDGRVDRPGLGECFRLHDWPPP